MKKIIGLILWAIAFLIPFQFSLLSTQDVGNITGLVSFVALIALIFTGYALIDSASGKPAAGEHGH